MNKQEAIEKLNKEYNDFLSSPQPDGPFLEGYISASITAKSIINQIDEPQRVVIPKLVAEWFSKNPLNGWWRKIDQWEQEVPLDDKEVYEWYSNYNETKFMQAWIAYPNVEVEKEKLYVVEIAEAILTKITRGNKVQYKFLNFADVSDVFEKTIYTTRLTEREIKQKDERLWQFAKEVDDDTR